MEQKKQPYAFLFWYKSSEYSPTEYIYIIAFTHKQACYFYDRAGYRRMYDYSHEYCDARPASEWNKPHEVGDILGQYAVI